jgi:hypothetical protein
VWSLFDHSPPVRSDDLDVFAADARKFYSHAKEPILLFRVIGGEGILMHGDKRIVTCAARPREVWEHLFDSSDVGCQFAVESTAGAFA